MFYDNLKSICDEKNLKITTVVEKCGGNKGSLKSWRNGTEPNCKIIKNLCVYLS